MGSKSSKAQHLTSTKPGVTIKLPQEIIDEILDHLTADSDLRFLRSCALVSKPWVESCRRHLFYTILFTSKDMAKWLKAFPVPQQSPARHVRDLRFSLGGYYGAPEEFFRCTPWFTNVKKMTLLGHGGFRPLLMPLSVRLPQSVTSLTINTDTIALTQIRDVMAQLPNLDDLSLSGSVVVDRGTLPWMGAILRGRFGGQLRLLKGHANPDVVNMLLEVPTGLHFTEVEVRGTYECLLSTVRLAESCAKTLVKLSYAVSFHDGRETFERSFDCSIFPNLQEVNFGVGWSTGSLRWIALAFSTLKPATSPRLSAIQLNFVGPSFIIRPTEVPVEGMGDDLRRVANEISRIKEEFAGAVNFTVLRDPWFKVVLDTLHILRN